MKLVILLLISMGSCAVAHAGTDRPLTLHDCIGQALGKNPGLKAAQYTLQADKEDIWRAKSAFLPEVTGSAGLYALTGSPPGPWEVVGISDFDTTGIVNHKAGQPSTVTRAPLRVSLAPAGIGGIGVTYPIYANGSILGLNNPPAVKMAKANYSKQSWSIRLTEQEVIAKLVGIFLSTTVYEQKVELDQQKLNLSKQRLAIVQEELRLNLVLPQQVDIAKAELAANQQLLMTTQQRAADSERILVDFLNRPPTQKLHLDQTQPAIPSLPPLEKLLNQVVASHPAIQAEKENVVLAQQQYRLAQTALYPSVNAGVNFSGATAFRADNNLDALVAQVGVQVPIFDFGHKLAAEHAALDQVKAAQAQLDEVQLNIRESILGQISQIHTTESSLADLERNFVQANSSVELIQSEHEQGIANQLALVDAELGLVAAKDDLMITQLVLRLEYAQLQRMAGGVWAWNR
ncbi:MAG: TolC family protein [Verrucomicrobia bacterium]|nr:TolC family protein [Verrucomicrobiota bacterium]